MENIKKLERLAADAQGHYDKYQETRAKLDELSEELGFRVGTLSVSFKVDRGKTTVFVGNTQVKADDAIRLARNLRAILGDELPPELEKPKKEEKDDGSN